MKLICDGLDLYDAVLKVSKALGVKTANPVLEGIKISAFGDTLTLVATDTELTIVKKIKADVLMEGETVVVGKYFVEFAKKLEKEQVELCRLEEGSLQIKYSDSISELQVFPVEGFPKIKTEEDGNFFKVKQSEFKNIVEKTVFACSTDDSRPILKGCLFEITNQVLTAVALDGFRMSVLKKNVVASGDFKTVIPSRTLVEISRLLEKDDEEVTVILQKNTLVLEVENTILISRLIEGEFVKYNHILPASFENVVTVSKQALLSSIERASIVSRNDRYNVIKLDITDDIMKVSSKSEVGAVDEKVPVVLKGKDLTVAFNGKFITDFLRISSCDYLNINLNSAIDPCVIKEIGEEEFLYLILPVRINA